MSSNCPPQLQLSLQPSTTSFKRSFEQFGFDLESPGGATDAGGSGVNNGNDRNKRARSASSFSESSDSMDTSHLSTIASGSSGSSPSRHEPDDTVTDQSTTSTSAVLGASLSTHSGLEPPRLPTPDIQDIEMPDYPADGNNSESFADSLAPQMPNPEDRYQLSIDHYNHFHGEMSGLRHPQPNSPLVSRSPTSPPILPPLYISEDQTRLSTSAIPFLHSSPQLHSTTSHVASFFDNQGPSSSIRTQSPISNRDNSIYEEQGQGPGHQHDSLFQNEFQPTHDPLEFSLQSNRPQSLSNSNNTSSSRSVRWPVPAARHMISTSNTAHFREHLNSALDHLRSPSPLVPGLEDIGQDTSLLQPSHVNNRISRALPNPPTLPPIVTDTANGNWDQNSPLLDILTSQASAGSSRDTSSFTSPTTNFDSRASVSSNSNIGLRDHPLPSPGLDDLHNWMNSSSSGSSHSWDISQIPAPSGTADSRQESSNVVNYQGTSSSSSAGQSRADHTASTPQRTPSSPIGPRPPIGTSLPLRNRWFMRISDLEGNRPPASTSTSTSTSTSQSDSDSQSNPNSSSIGLHPFSLNRRSVDENAVRSLDQGFDSRLSFSARPSPALGLSRLDYAERFRLHEAQSAEVAARRARASNIWIADEADPADRELTNFQTDTASRPTLLVTALERRRTLRETFPGRTVDEPDNGDNSSAGPSPTSQAASRARYPDPESTLVESRPVNNSSRDLYLRHRLRAYGAQFRPGASNSLVNESASEVRRRADRIEVNERINEVNREDRRNSRSSVGGGAVGDLFDSHLRSVETDLRQNGMSSLGWDPLPLNRRSFGSTNDSAASREDTRRPQGPQEWAPTHWNHVTWRQPPSVNHRASYQLSLPPRNILPLPGLPSNDDMDTTIGESIGFRPTDFTPSSASSNTNTRNNHILSSSLYDNTGTSRTTGRPSDYFWLNTSRSAPADQNNLDTAVSSELPSPTPDTDIFDIRYSDMVNAITSASSSTGGVQRRHSASSDDSSHSDGVHETRSNQPYLGDPPSLPPPDLGGVFDAERHASSIAISDESPETIFVHPPQRPSRDTSSGISSNNPVINPPPPSIPIQNNANSSTNNPNASNIRISYADIRQRQPAPPLPDLDALLTQRQRRSEGTRRLLEENREMVRSSAGSNPTTSTHTHTQSIADLLQRSSALSRSHRNSTTIEPTERRNHARSVPSTSEPPSARLDPSSFTPGPFRNTVQQLFNERRHVQRRHEPSPSVPPTIPPLSFEEDDLSSSLQQRILLHQLRRQRDTAQATNATIDHDRVRRERAAIAEEGVRRERMSDRLAAARGTSENNRREQSDIHRYLTQQARMEASRIEDSETPVSTHRSGGHNNQGSIDALRYDGLNTVHTTQLIERFHRDQANSRAGPAEAESTPATTGTSAGAVPAGPRWSDGRRVLPHSLMRRESGRPAEEERRSMIISAFTAQAAQHINQEDYRESEELTGFHSTRGRRGRFTRIPSEAMFSFGRQGRRGGTFGDYVRDEDFDDSYEGLLSLSATLGDAKPKSTPASILSDLETAQYKDWATPESDQRCPICLDDYQPTDQVLKLNNCSHWLHKDCLHQWLQGARTCPVCRKSVFPISQASSSSSPRRAQYHRLSLQHYPFFGGPNLSGRRDHPPPPPSPPGGGTLDPV